jgi:hypothetical protein
MFRLRTLVLAAFLAAAGPADPKVQAVTREAGMRRDKFYGTFGGKVDPTRVLKLLSALNVRLWRCLGWLDQPQPDRNWADRENRERSAGNQSDIVRTRRHRKPTIHFGHWIKVKNRRHYAFDRVKKG